MKIIPEIFISAGKRPKKSIAQNPAPRGSGPRDKYLL